MKFICDNEQKLDEVAKKLLELAKNRHESESEPTSAGAFVVGLNGDLGSGKTAFTKRIAKMLDVDAEITSPTYVIQKNFDINFGKFKKLFHLDVYRLESPGELDALRWLEIISNPENIVLVEWADTIRESLPENVTNMNFAFIDDKTREVEIIE